jgi:hypothetical protein
MGKGQGREEEMMDRGLARSDSRLSRRSLPQGSVDALEATETL